MSYPTVELLGRVERRKRSAVGVTSYTWSDIRLVPEPLGIGVDCHRDHPVDLGGDLNRDRSGHAPNVRFSVDRHPSLYRRYCWSSPSAATAAQFPAPGKTMGNPVIPATGVLLYVS